MPKVRQQFANLRVRAFVALILLAALQISYAGHSFVHSFGDIPTTCDVCLQLDRIDDAVAGTSLFIAASEGFIFSAHADGIEFASEFAPPYQSRAPPLV